MINTLIFDFGDVLINLDKEGAFKNALRMFDLKEFDSEMMGINESFEVGSISENDFLSYYKDRFPYCTSEDILHAWNFILRDFPYYRFDFIRHVKKSKNFKLILLSNTNALHIEHIKQQVPFYNDFKNCFNKFYLSHEIGLRKPNADIFNFIIKENKLNAENCLFIDDTKENTLIAEGLGFKTWNIDEKTEDVINLFQIKKNLF